ncbi:MAG: GNAT family N-acetyltransferase [Proteobacteria bacterium]|nr:GNAT family N-acetyltransferase [Pseudomonadota bacterium]
MKRRDRFRRICLGSRWRERIVLPGGRELLLRPIDPADLAPIRDGFVLLYPEEVRLRYLHAVKALDDDYLRKLVRPRRGLDFVLVLAEPLPPGEALVGAVARFSRASGARDAEFAILVSHFLAGHGLGHLLLRKLIERARRCGLTSLYGDVLAENAPMLRLADALGFARQASDEPGTVRVRRTFTARQVADVADTEARLG